MHVGDPTGGVPEEGEGEQGQNIYQAEMFPWFQRIYRWQPWIVLCTMVKPGYNLCGLTPQVFLIDSFLF